MAKYPNQKSRFFYEPPLNPPFDSSPIMQEPPLSSIKKPKKKRAKTKKKALKKAKGKTRMASLHSLSLGDSIQPNSIHRSLPHSTIFHQLHGDPDPLTSISHNPFEITPLTFII